MPDRSSGSSSSSNRGEGNRGEGWFAAIDRAVGWCFHGGRRRRSQNEESERQRVRTRSQPARRPRTAEPLPAAPPPPFSSWWAALDPAALGGGTSLAPDEVRAAVWRLPLEEYSTAEELRAWPIKQLVAELRLARARAPRSRVGLDAQPPLDKEELVEAVLLARGGEAAHACAICVEDFESGDTLRVLRCGHRFHLE
ncbi:hypothetical protein EMIHUDRAFT_446831, partial [Emiliania huxleyi CCMP1516]|uniref:RING-type domain-containing protein n=3 Tax=Emiliania huxleyi TaxID=2903 RepID=A0A0D3KU55_EMIH1